MTEAAFDDVRHTNVLAAMRLLPQLTDARATGAKLAVLSSIMGSIGQRSNGDGWLYNDGGFTIAYTGDNADTYKIAYSVCSNDNFCRAKGREIALHRFEAGHIITKAFADSADEDTNR